MPFISKDWRSPGEDWVKYDGGWEKKSIVTIQSYDSCIKENTEHLDLIQQPKHQTPKTEASAVSLTLNRRKKNLSECDKENQDPVEYHRILLQEHIRRIRGNLPPHIEEQNLPQNQPLDNEPVENRYSPQRTNSNILLRLVECPGQAMAPYFPVTVKSTREVAGFNALAEALLRLDFIHAVSDVRRFHYVSQLMYLLFAHDKLSVLPGAAQKVLFRMLEEMANTVYKSNANEHVFRKLMDELQTTMTIYRVWGSHLGSSQLFKQHLESRRRITEFVEKVQVEYKQDLATPSSPGLVSALPEECIREILLRLSDPRDLEQASKTCEAMKAVASEKRVWRELVQTHFTKMQIEFVLQEKPQLKDSKDWKELYASLRRKFGLREEFTEMLMLCRKCCALFWKNLGHPCFVFDSDFDSSDSDTAMADNSSSMSSKSAELIPVSPKSFLTFFSV